MGVLNFCALILKMYHFCGLNIFLRLFVIQSTQFFGVSTFFLLNIRMPMVTKLFRVVTCGDELSPINAHDISTEWSCWVKLQIKYISPPAENVLGRCWHSFRGSQTWPFDQVTKMRSCDCLKNLYLYFHEVYC